MKLMTRDCHLRYNTLHRFYKEINQKAKQGLYVFKYKSIKKFKNHHMTKTTVGSVSGKNHQWMLKSVGKSIMRTKIFAYFVTLQQKT